MSGYLVPVYLVYAVASISLTVWLARTLYRNGAVFLEDVFEDRPELARAVNRLLVTGFYMLNLGYAFLILRSPAPFGAVAAVETLAWKLGILLVSLALLHFTNLYVFYRIRRRAGLRDEAPPVPGQTWTPTTGGAPGWGPPPEPWPQPQ